MQETTYAVVLLFSANIPVILDPPLFKEYPNSEDLGTSMLRAQIYLRLNTQVTIWFLWSRGF